MQFELTLSATDTDNYSARDLGFLLHKHPDHLHQRSVTAGMASIFYTEKNAQRTTAVLHLDVDPVGLVRGSGKGAEGLLDHYVNDRPYVANSFLSVALGRSYGQSMAGISKERQELADRALPFEARVTPVAVSGGEEVVRKLFEPLGYDVTIDSHEQPPASGLYDLRLAATTHLNALLKHVYVLVPVLDNAKHWWVGHDEIDQLMAKGEGWLADHPANDLITRRALKHRRGLVNMALARLAEDAVDDRETEEGSQALEPETAFERPARLHDLRLDTVLGLLKEHGASSVLDLGCGEGKLLQRLVKERTIERIVGVDPSLRVLEIAARRLHLDEAGDAMRARLSLQLGSLTYGDRRWHGFDAATLVEVIEHIDPERLSALELSLFADARPRLIILTTPNREYNALFENMPDSAFRHPDHRFEWTREAFGTWGSTVAESHGYSVRFEPFGPADDVHGSLSQIAIFERDSGEKAA